MSVSIISAAALLERFAQTGPSAPSARQQFALVDARKKEEFDQAHIPGAVHLAWEDFCQVPPERVEPVLRQPGYWGKLDDLRLDHFARILSTKGLDNRTPIVVYDNGVLSKGSQGRLAWMLLYLGAQHVLLLDGGWPGWHAATAGQSTAVQCAEIAPRHFQISLRPERRVTIEQLKLRLTAGKLPLLVDTRSQMEFAGQCYDYQPRMGRMPNSVLVPFEALFQADGAFIDGKQFSRLLPAGLDGTTVAYCEVGVRASTFALLHEVHTNQPILVYDGSLMEWSLEHDLPVISQSSCGA